MQTNSSGISRYEDIIDLPHHQSAYHPPMRMEERASQFSPFAALTGYGDTVKETARLTTQRIELDEDRKEELNRLLQLLAAQLQSEGHSQLVSVTYFCPDARKAGGAYRSETGVICKLPSDVRVIVLENENGERRNISIEEILKIERL